MELKQEVDDSLFSVEKIKLEIENHFISNETVKDIWNTHEGSKISNIIKNELVVIKQESSNDPQDDHSQQTRTNPMNHTDQIDTHKKSEVAHVKDFKKLRMGTSAKILPGGILICKLCGNLYIRKVELFHHLSRHFVKKKCLSKYMVKENNSNKNQPLQTDNNKLFIEEFQDSSNRESFNCSICLKSFTKKNRFQYHVRNHSGEKPFKCEICSKSFGVRDTLKRHILCHSGEKPFNCEICMKSYSKKYHVTRHMLSHTGEKPHKCEICLKTFSEKGTLNRHKLWHTGENPFKCDICLKPFGQKGNMIRHMRNHANDVVIDLCDI